MRWPVISRLVGGDGNSEHGSVYQDGDPDDKVPMSEEKDSVFGHTHHRAVRSNDLSGAIGTWHYGECDRGSISTQTVHHTI